MSEERTPIKELISEHNNHFNKIEFSKWISDNRSRLLEADKAYREKYKHTKEDVLRIGQEYGHFVALCEREGRPLLLMEDWFEQYYNETHNK